MDSFQPPYQFTRAPPPPSADPHVSHQIPPPAPPQGSWYSGQFQYHPSFSPSPPPPPPHQWGSLPPPQSDHFPPPLYDAHHNPPYPAHPHHTQYPPPPPPPPPPRPPRPQIPPPSHPPQPYTQVNQEWETAKWAHQSSWDYPAHSNEEDWASRAKAWAAARAATENQHPQSHFPSMGRLEEHTYYNNQYPQVADFHYQDRPQASVPVSSYQSFPVQAEPLNKPPLVHQQEPSSISSVQSSYAPDVHFLYTAKDGNFSGEAGTAFPYHQRLTSPSVHQQEVPSSYSSVTGKEDVTGGQYHDQPPLPAASRSMLTEPAQFAYGNQSMEPMADPYDQPLEFAPRFNYDNNPRMQSSYPDSVASVSTESIAALPPLHPWTPSVAPSVSYPSTLTFLSAPQHDPSLGIPPVPGPPAPMFGRAPGSSFQPAIPSVAAPAGLGVGTLLHPATFPGDAYGAAMGSERPKKAAVPNWLREEIIKKKATIVNSLLVHIEEETQSVEDETVDKSVGKGDQAASKSIDSTKSTEEEDDDEDYVEAARTAAINQEIKRILTEVLLKVTNELFDEIATEVLSEDDLISNADHDTYAPNHKLLPPPPAFPAAKASARILVPANAKESEADNVTERSSSGAPGDVLGLASYASDDDDVIHSSNDHLSSNSTVHILSSNNEHRENKHDAVKSGHLNAETEEPKHNGPVNLEEDHSNSPSIRAQGNHSVEAVNMAYHGLCKDLDSGDIGPVFNSAAASLGGKDDAGADDASKTKSNRGKLIASKPEVPPVGDNVRKSTKEDCQERDTGRHDKHESKRSSSARDSAEEIGGGKVRDEENRGRHDERLKKKEKIEDYTGRHDRHASKRSSSARDSAEDVGSGKVRDEENRGRHDERLKKKDKIEDYNDHKESAKELANYKEKTKEAESRKRSSCPEVKEGMRERKRVMELGDKDDFDRKREQMKDEKADRSRNKVASDASKHRTRHSSSDGSKGRYGKDNSVVRNSDESSDEAFESSRRMMSSKKCHLSPSPARSKNRQFLPSPHSKHQRRHSPYSSLESSRGRRSRSRSPRGHK
ncbi:hypothetical protein Nepgr_029499 [Nepenthes gracilis]|uniref:Uncharacterized protein n=1 Tax=Nepenthes gracilis TaxID=150966 RepID=A0AAD3TE93_NEPGR|nr:hypothetical protein Nepgr_029499 [Nepenthes gracilis]